MTEQQAEGQPFWMRMSNEDIACELSATFDLGLLVTRCIAAWILDENLDEYLEEWTAEAESQQRACNRGCGEIAVLIVAVGCGILAVIYGLLIGGLR